MRRAFVFAALLLVIVALTRRRPEPVPDLSELSYGDLPSWPSVRVG